MLVVLNIFLHFMDRWRGLLKVPLCSNGRACYQVAASLCLDPTSKNLAVPSANAIFFSGDRVAGTGNPVIERLSDLQHIAEVLVSKIGGSVNAWVIEASVFNGPFAVFKDIVPSVNGWGEPKSYDPVGFPSSKAIILLLSKCLQEVQSAIPPRQTEKHPASISESNLHHPKVFVFGFSKGGTVLNQLVSELGFSHMSPRNEDKVNIIPSTKESLLGNIAEIHYVDVGLNSPGAYITDDNVIAKVSRHIIETSRGMRFILHGTPRQWCDSRRPWIQNEKDRLLHLLQSEAQRSKGKLRVCERFYFADKTPDLQMHFEIVENLDIS